MGLWESKAKARGYNKWNKGKLKAGKRIYIFSIKIYQALYDGGVHHISLQKMKQKKKTKGLICLYIMMRGQGKAQASIGTL